MEWVYDKSRERLFRAAENLLQPTDELNSLLNITSSILYGNDKFFVPRWRIDYGLKDPQYFNPTKWTYIYDNSPLVKTTQDCSISDFISTKFQHSMTFQEYTCKCLIQL